MQTSICQFAFLAIALGCLGVFGSEAYHLQPPPGLDLFVPVPEDNPLTREKVELGWQLFFDKRLARDGAVSCATCHIPERAFADGNSVAVGIGGRKGRRNAPSLFNRAYGKAFFWDGRARSLEEQPLEAILNPQEMDLTREELERRLNKLKVSSGVDEGRSYRDRLEEVFGQSFAAADERKGEAGASRYVAPSSRSAMTAEKTARAIATDGLVARWPDNPYRAGEEGSDGADRTRLGE